MPPSAILFCLAVWIIGGVIFLITDTRPLAARFSVMAWWAYLMGMAVTLLVIGAHLVKW